MSRFDLPIEGPPSYPPPPHSFRSAAANFGDAVGRMSKRVTFLLAIWGIISTTSTTAIAWWMTHQDYVTADQRAKDNRVLADIDRKVDRIEFNISGVGPQIKEIADSDRKQDNRLTALEARRR